MLRRSLPCPLLVFAACGGGGGAVAPLPVSTAARLAAENVEIAPAATSADVVVRLAAVPAEAPRLLQVAVELPPGLVLPPSDRLQAIAAVSQLDGDFVGERFVIVCGDAQNPAAAPLAAGPLFRLRVAPTTPRAPGSYQLRFTDLRAASRDGQVPVPVAASPTEITVVVR
ncbi:MAG: hypothetical protein QM775_24825 [Pirellulales bacterium]